MRVLISHIHNGRVRPLVLFGIRRSPLLPDVPLAADQGLARVDLSAWIGLFAPAGTPDLLVARVNAEVVKIPYVVVWGDKESQDAIAVRTHGGDQSTKSLDELVAKLRDEAVVS